MVARVFVENGWIMGRRIGEEPEPITLPGAPTMGAEAGAAQWFAERLADVRVAAALLQAAAEHVDFALNTTRCIKFLPLAAQPAWVRPLIGAMEPLKRIIESCAAFEDAVAGAQILPNEMRDIPADIVRRATFAVPIAREDQIVDRRVTRGAESVAIAAVAAPVALPHEKTRETIAKAMATAEAARPYIEAVDRVAPALAKAEAVRRYADAIDRAAPIVSAVEALGPHARLAPLTSLEAAAAAIASARALSAAELADLDRIGLSCRSAAQGSHQGDAAIEADAIRRPDEAHKQEKDPN